jgi:hypothetical protein
VALLRWQGDRWCADRLANANPGWPVTVPARALPPPQTPGARTSWIANRHLLSGLRVLRDPRDEEDLCRCRCRRAPTLLPVEPPTSSLIPVALHLLLGHWPGATSPVQPSFLCFEARQRRSWIDHFYVCPPETLHAPQWRRFWILAIMCNGVHGTRTCSAAACVLYDHARPLIIGQQRLTSWQRNFSSISRDMAQTPDRTSVRRPCPVAT